MPDSVPDQFRHLIPFVKRWGVAPGAQDALIANSSPDQISEFCQAIEPCQEAIRDWITEWTTHGDSEVPEAISKFSYTLGSYEMVRPLAPGPQERFRQKQAEMEKAATRSYDLSRAQEAFRERRFDEVVARLEPHEATLDGVVLRKLEAARQRLLP